MFFQQSSEHLDQHQRAALANTLVEFADVFSKDDFDVGTFAAVKHRINTNDATPIRQPVRRTPLGFQGEDEEHLRKMINAKIVVPSESEWASPVVLVRKKDGGVRWCIDYRS